MKTNIANKNGNLKKAVICLVTLVLSLGFVLVVLYATVIKPSHAEEVENNAGVAAVDGAYRVTSGNIYNYINSNQLEDKYSFFATFTIPEREGWVGSVIGSPLTSVTAYVSGRDQNGTGLSDKEQYLYAKNFWLPEYRTDSPLNGRSVYHRTVVKIHTGRDKAGEIEESSNSVAFFPDDMYIHWDNASNKKMTNIQFGIQNFLPEDDQNYVPLYNDVNEGHFPYGNSNGTRFTWIEYDNSYSGSGKPSNYQLAGDDPKHVYIPARTTTKANLYGGNWSISGDQDFYPFIRYYTFNLPDGKDSNGEDVLIDSTGDYSASEWFRAVDQYGVKWDSNNMIFKLVGDNAVFRMDDNGTLHIISVPQYAKKATITVYSKSRNSNHLEQNFTFEINVGKETSTLGGARYTAWNSGSSDFEGFPMFQIDNAKSLIAEAPTTYKFTETFGGNISTQGQLHRDKTNENIKTYVNGKIVGGRWSAEDGRPNTNTVDTTYNPNLTRVRYGVYETKLVWEDNHYVTKDNSSYNTSYAFSLRIKTESLFLAGKVCSFIISTNEAGTKCDIAEDQHGLVVNKFQDYRETLRNSFMAIIDTFRSENGGPGVTRLGTDEEYPNESWTDKNSSVGKKNFVPSGIPSTQIKNFSYTGGENGTIAFTTKNDLKEGWYYIYVNEPDWDVGEHKDRDQIHFFYLFKDEKTALENNNVAVPADTEIELKLYHYSLNRGNDKEEDEKAKTTYRQAVFDSFSPTLTVFGQNANGLGAETGGKSFDLPNTGKLSEEPPFGVNSLAEISFFPNAVNFQFTAPEAELSETRFNITDQLHTKTTSYFMGLDGNTSYPYYREKVNGNNIYGVEAIDVLRGSDGDGVTTQLLVNGLPGENDEGKMEDKQINLYPFLYKYYLTGSLFLADETTSTTRGVPELNKDYSFTDPSMGTYAVYNNVDIFEGNGTQEYGINLSGIDQYGVLYDPANFTYSLEGINPEDGLVSLSGNKLVVNYDNLNEDTSFAIKIVANTNNKATEDNTYTSDKTTTISIPVTLYKKYTISYNANFEGSSVAPQTQVYTNLGKETYADVWGDAMPTPTNVDGYKFLGWFDANNNPVVADMPLTGDITLTAQWKKLNVYTINYVNPYAEHPFIQTYEEVNPNENVVTTSRPVGVCNDFDDFVFIGWTDLDDTNIHEGEDIGAVKFQKNGSDLTNKKFDDMRTFKDQPDLLSSGEAVVNLYAIYAKKTPVVFDPFEVYEKDGSTSNASWKDGKAAENFNFTYLSSDADKTFAEAGYWNVLEAAKAAIIPPIESKQANDDYLWAYELTDKSDPAYAHAYMLPKDPVEGRKWVFVTPDTKLDIYGYNLKALWIKQVPVTATISMDIQGDYADFNKKFNVELTLKDTKGTLVSATVNDIVFVDGKATVAMGKGDTINLCAKDGQKSIFEDYQLTVCQPVVDGYYLSIDGEEVGSENNSKTITLTKDGSNNTALLNEYPDPPIDTGIMDKNSSLVTVAGILAVSGIAFAVYSYVKRRKA